MHHESLAQGIAGWSLVSAPLCRCAELALRHKTLHLDICAKLSTALISADEMSKMTKELLFWLSL